MSEDGLKSQNQIKKTDKEIKTVTDEIAVSDVSATITNISKPKTTRKKATNAVEKITDKTVKETVNIKLTEKSKTKNTKSTIVMPVEKKLIEEPNLAIKTAELVDKKIITDKAIVDSIHEKEVATPNKKGFFAKLRKKRIRPVPLSQVKRYSPNLKAGLSTNLVQLRNTEQLINDVDTKYSKTYKNIFISNIFTFFNLLCFITAGALIYVKANFSDMFFVVVFSLNIIIGIYQEIKAKLSIEKLSLLSSPTAKVIRDSIESEISVKEIVLDDVILLSTGKQVPTDCILAEGIVEVNESLLTGESVPVKKDIGDTLFAGSFISSGNCKVRAEKVGKANYIQTLTSKAKKYKKPNSELLNSLKLIMTIVGLLIIPISALMFKINYDVLEHDIPLTILKTAAVIIGMIPAGMFLLTSMALAVGVIRLAKNNTLVQDLYALEMLARIDVLCLDKTGTITDGRMKVNDCLLLNNNTSYTINEIIGAMLSALNDNNQTSIALYNHFGYSNVMKSLKILPFSSKRKLSAVTFADAGTFVLGAPEFIMQTLPDKVDRLIGQYAATGLRVLMIAHSSAQLNGDKIPSSLKPMALITITDNIREDAVHTIKWFKENGVAIKVISGDNPITVSEVARRVGVENAEKFISLEGLNDKEIISVANKYSVFGRVTPEQKAVLVKALKASGKTVAMTGDGVNDILALKEADCSITVASGSEAARNVSHLVLMDNNFSSMPKVVYEGRRVINNIQKSSSLYLMKTLFTTILAIISIIQYDEYPFSTSSLLLLETFIIGVPSFFLSLQPNANKVNGKFISYVLSRAIPSAFILVGNVMLFKAVHWVIPEFDNDLLYETMATIVLTYAGLVLLFRISQPMNAYRGFLFGIMFLLCSAALIYLGPTDVLKLNSVEWKYMLIIVCLVQFDFPLSKWLFDIFDKIRGVNTNLLLKK
jgi:cation-transporting ATPase E